MVFIKRQSVKTTDKNATTEKNRTTSNNNRYQLELFYVLFHFMVFCFFIWNIYIYLVRWSRLLYWKHLCIVDMCASNTRERKKCVFFCLEMKNVTLWIISNSMWKCVFMCLPIWKSILCIVTAQGCSVMCFYTIGLVTSNRTVWDDFLKTIFLLMQSTKSKIMTQGQNVHEHHPTHCLICFEIISFRSVTYFKSHISRVV